MISRSSRSRVVTAVTEGTSGVPDLTAALKGAGAPLDNKYVFTSRASSTHNSRTEAGNTVPDALLSATPRQAPGSALQAVPDVLPPFRVGRDEAAERAEGEQLRDLETLTRWAMLSAVREVVPGHRTASCSRFIVPPSISGAEGVQVIHRAAGERRSGARFGNLTRCANVWACPVCSPRIAQNRAEDLRALLGTHAAQGGRVLFATLTHRHGRADDLEHQIAQQGRALEHMQRQRAFRDWSRRAGVLGIVRALEFTHSDANGWHPHFHLLLLVAGDRRQAVRHAQVMTVQDAARRTTAGQPRQPVAVPRVRHLPALGEELVAAWLASCDAVGLDAEPQAQRCEVAPADLRTLERLADYLGGPGGAADLEAFAGDAQAHAAARLAVEAAGQGRAGTLAGAAYEAAGAALKLARGEQGRTPFELLREYTEQGRPRAGRLFADYVQATKGRRALSYSNGLRALYLLGDEATPEEAAQEQERPEERELCQISLDDWRVLLRGHRANRGRLLEVARRGDPDAVRDMVQLMVQAVARGEVRALQLPPPPPSPAQPVPEPAEPMPVLLGGHDVQAQQAGTVHATPGGADGRSLELSQAVTVSAERHSGRPPGRADWGVPDDLPR